MVETLNSAGGVVVGRDAERGSHVALVQTHGGDWVLPKGHVEHGETLEEAALREVFEETSLSTDILRIERYVGVFDFNEHDDTGSKLNHFFLMHLTSDSLPSLQTDREHRSARWWPVPLQGLELALAYPYQQRLLEGLGLWESRAAG